MLNGIKGVIFDLDGTLVDSMWIWPQVDHDYMEKYGLKKPMDMECLIEGKGCNEIADMFLTWFSTLNKTRTEIVSEWMDMTYDKYVNDVTLKKGAKEFIYELSSAGVMLGIASSNAKELIHATLDSLNVRQYFSSIHSADEVKHGKPSPEVYLKVLEDFGIPSKNCLVFEDIPMGILAGKNAGMKVCAVEDSFSANLKHKKEELADFYIESYDDIKHGTYKIL